MHDFEGLSRHLLSNINSILTLWLPGGRIQGSEYCCADLRGGRGDSCRVNIKTGVWCEFAGGPDEKGGDLISLYARIHGKTQGEAYLDLCEQFRFNHTNPNPPALPKQKTPIVPPATSHPPMRHSKFGLPVKTWVYRDEAGQPCFYVARYDTPDGKQFLPWTYTSEQRWQCKGWPAPRPLYNLDKLAARPKAPVLICEGEKAADAAEELTQGIYVCTTWPNGSKAVSKANWAFLRDRNVLIWPDADAPGRAAADQIAQILAPISATVKVLDVTGQPSGWDAADAIEGGWRWDGFKEWAKPRAIKIDVTVSESPANVSGSVYAMWEQLGLPTTTNGSPIINTEAIYKVLTGTPGLNEIVWIDRFHQKILTHGPREWTDVDTLELCLKIQSEFGLKRLGDDTVYKTLRILAARNERNEPRDWMNSLVWDGQARVERFFVDYFGCQESGYVLSASKNWWISLVARIFEPGCQMDNMLILKGKQGIYKSTALRIIGGQWYANSGHNVLSKDFYQSLQGKLIIEIAELDTFDRASINTIKDVVSNPTDRFRVPYERSPADHPRQCVFVGTTNEDLILKDYTGGRRFWPVEVSKIDIDRIREDRAQLFAEAVHLYKEGHEWHVMPADETAEVQEKNRQYDEWENYLASYLEKNYLLHETTVFDIAKECFGIPIDRIDKLTQMRLARCLSSVGWKNFLVRESGIRKRVWRKNDE